MVKEKVPAKLAHHVVVKGEPYTSLLVYMSKNPAVLVTDDPPGQDANHPAPEAEHLDEKTRLLIFSLIDMLDDFVNEGICLLILRTQYIAILNNGRPKIVGASFVNRKEMAELTTFKTKVSENYHDMASIISRVIVGTLPKPADLSHLLYLMENQAWSMRYLINYHSATVPLENSTTLYVRLHNYAWHILRIKDPKGFHYLMFNLEFNEFWRQEIPYNSHLKKYMKKAYENTEPAGTKEYFLKETRQVSRLNRNVPSHPLDYALDISTASGMAYSQCLELGHIFRSNFARLTYSLQAGLQAIDRLKFTEIKSLFSNSIKVHRKIR